VDRLNHRDSTGHHTDRVNDLDLERRLELAERRYAAARDAYEKARAELRELNSRKDPNPQLVKAARARLEAVVERCTRLRALIEQLEDRLD
jgi:chromosome segregation ATPase